jgi:hypothetical protein
MPATLESLSSKRVTLTIPLDPSDPAGDALRVVYRPRAITPRLEKAMREAAAADDEDEIITKLARHFCTLVVEWDLRARSDSVEPVPLTAEGLLDVPSSVILDIYRAINADQMPDPTTGKDSRKRS